MHTITQTVMFIKKVLDILVNVCYIINIITINKEGKYAI